MDGIRVQTNADKLILTVGLIETKSSMLSTICNIMTKAAIFYSYLPTNRDYIDTNIKIQGVSYFLNSLGVIIFSFMEKIYKIYF